MINKRVVTISIFLGIFLLYSLPSKAQIGYNIDTFLVHSQKKDYPNSFTYYEFLPLFGIFKEYKWWSQAMLKLSEKETDLKKKAVLHQKYTTAQYCWNLYLDTLQGYIKEYPTIKQDFINRNEVLRTALEAIRDYLMYYKKHYSHLYMSNLLYRKKTISTLIDYYNVGYNLFDYYERIEKTESKNAYRRHVTILYWKTLDEILQEAPVNSPNK